MNLSAKMKNHIIQQVIVIKGFLPGKFPELAPIGLMDYRSYHYCPRLQEASDQGAGTFVPLR